MADRIVLKWTSKIHSFSCKGLMNQALFWFQRMRRAGIEPNECTFSIALTVCAQSVHEAFGLGLHGLVLKTGYSTQLFVSGGLISMYCNYDRVGEARRVFDEMPERDAVVWNSMISGYTRSGLNEEACRLFYGLVTGFGARRGFVNDFTLASVFNACADLEWSRLGESAHGHAIKVCFDSNVFVGSSLVDMYANYGELVSARRVFDELRNRDVVVWNSMITGYLRNGYEDEAIELFLTMQHWRLSPNYTTFSAIIDASSALPNDTFGKSLHAKTLKFGLTSEVYTGTAIVDMYSKFLNMADAERAVSEMPKKNVVSYNALITGYGLTGDHENAFRTYTLLQIQGIQPDACTFISLFTACASSCTFVEGAQAHSHSVMLGLLSDVQVGNSIVNFYSKCGFTDCAMKAFETADAVSWAVIISGLVQNNEGDKALALFCEMHRLSRKADEYTSSSVIKAVASLAAIVQGRHLHGHMMKMGLNHKIFVGSSLIDMYSKCGMVEDAYKLFSEMPEKNVVSWNSMLTGYAQNGFSDEALLLFHEMEKYGMLPNSVTFVGILLACCHAGKVEEGRHYYRLMDSYYGISPSVEHCTCMVNLLGRSGYVDEAEAFLLDSPFTEEHCIWRSLLASCEAHRNFDVAARVAEHCLLLKPDDHSTYTILSNIYATKQLWSEVGSARDSMKMIGVAKEPGFSWVEGGP